MCTFCVLCAEKASRKFLELRDTVSACVRGKVRWPECKLATALDPREGGSLFDNVRDNVHGCGCDQIHCILITGPVVGVM